MNEEIKKFLATKIRSLKARARRLTSLNYLSVGLRPQDRPFAPSPRHFKAARQRLNTIDQEIVKRLKILEQAWGKVPVRQLLVSIALVEREVDRARRAFDLFFSMFSQRGTRFAPVLAAYDLIAADCYMAVRESAPQVFPGPILKPLSYLSQGFSPATNRRGVQLARLLGERNPFPIIRIPWDRDNPWQSAFLHEVSHNLQADLGVWQENQQAVEQRLLRIGNSIGVVKVYRRWHKEIWADLAALLLGGPASGWGLMDFLAHPGPKVFSYKPGGVHPTGYLRVLIIAEMVRRMGFEEQCLKMKKVWTTLYKPQTGHRIPKLLMESASYLIPHVVDEIAFQPRRNLAQRGVADVIQFNIEDEREIRKGARALVKGIVPTELPPRFLVSASRYALQEWGANPRMLSRTVVQHLTQLVFQATNKRVMGGERIAA